MAVDHDYSFGAWMQALGFNTFFGLFGALPVEAASAIGAAALKTIGPLTSTHKIARTNIRLAFPDITPGEEKALLKAAWENLGRVFCEYPHLHKMVTFGEGGRVEVEGVERLDAIAASDKGAVFIGGHFANFEIMASVIVKRGVPCQVTYRAMNNGYIERTMLRQREAYGAKMLAAKGKSGGMGILRALARGETTAMMNDQKQNEGVAAPFFGTYVMTADGPARLARRFDCPLVPISIVRLPGVRFRVRINEPIEISDDPDETIAIRDTVARVNAFMEEQIRAAPEQWFWVHRRWPKEVYRSDTPLETALSALSADGAISSSASAGST